MKPSVDDTKRESLVFDVISTWRGGALPDAQTFLNQHPELWSDKEVVLDLAAEEYALRRKTGEDLTPSVFCGRFPSVRSSLMRLVLVGEMISHSPFVHRAVDESVWPRPGQDFLGFRIVRQLGRGAFARVYLADEMELGGRRVVVKVAQFAGREAEILGKLSHPHVVPVFSVKSHHDVCLTVVCMPFLGEATLTDVLETAYANGSPPRSAEPILRAARVNPKSELQTRTPAAAPLHGSFVEGVAYLGLKIAQALAYTHGRSILHRDLKPSNVLVQPNGEPVLLDFNLSTDSEQDVVRAGGTVPYMAPEQLYAVFLEPHVDAATDDPRSDVFAFGVILYQLLSGRLPFQEPPVGIPDLDAAERMLRYQRVKPPSLSTLNKHVDAGLAQLVARCLDFDPAARPQSAAEVVAALEQRLATRQRIVSRIRRHWLATSLTLLFAAGSLGSLGFKLVNRPAYPERAFQRGLAAIHQEQFPAALEHLESARKAGANSATFFRALGLAQAQLQEWDIAAKYFEQAHQLEKDAVTCGWIGYCRSRSGVVRPAAFWYGQAAALGYSPPWIEHNAGHCYRSFGMFAKAKACLQRALELDSGNSSTILCFLELATSSQVVTRKEALAWAIQGERRFPDEPLFSFYAALFGLPDDGPPAQPSKHVQEHVQRAVNQGLDHHHQAILANRLAPFGLPLPSVSQTPGERTSPPREVLLTPIDFPQLVGPALAVPE